MSLGNVNEDTKSIPFTTVFYHRVVYSVSTKELSQVHSAIHPSMSSTLLRSHLNQLSCRTQTQLQAHFEGSDKATYILTQ